MTSTTAASVGAAGARDDGETAVAIVGAGPYGLSLAAHLRAHRIDMRIFGVPMATWRTQMPAGMHLKSEGFASDLYDPDGAFPLSRFCRDAGIPYADIGLPVALETFSNYGLAFARRFVPDLEEREVTEIAPAGNGFALRLADGGSLRARRVVVAAGITHYPYLPEILRGFPGDLVSHTSRHHLLAPFAGRCVVVVGAGASATDTAALLGKSGALTALVARTPALPFHDPPDFDRPLWKRVRYPRSGLGSSWKAKLFCDVPDAFYRLPAPTRIRIVESQLGPAPCWFTKADIVGSVALHLGADIARADSCDAGMRLQLRLTGGATRTMEADHVIAGTGYRVDLARLRFLRPELRARIRTAGGAPVLSSAFESSVAGLYFVGISAANSFGPMLRFAFGARFAATRLSKHLSAVHGSRPIRSASR